MVARLNGGGAIGATGGRGGARREKEAERLGLDERRKLRGWDEEGQEEVNDQEEEGSTRNKTYSVARSG
jgi:hypothetical protein